MNRRILLIAIVALLAVVVGFFILRDWVIPTFSQPVSNDLPTRAPGSSLSDRLTQTAAAPTAKP